MNGVSILLLMESPIPMRPMPTNCIDIATFTTQ